MNRSQSSGRQSLDERRWRGLLWGLLTLTVLVMPGCGGCREETPQERAAREEREAEQAEKERLEREKKKKPPPLVVGDPAPQPNQAASPLKLVKPGHWMAATQSMKANNDNWVGEATLQVVDRQNQPIPLDRTAFTVRSERDVALAKGEPKEVESVFFVPPPGADQQGKPKQLSSRITLRERGASLSAPPANKRLEAMKPHQHHLVILAAEPRRYDYVRSLNSIQEPFASEYEFANSFGPTMMSWQYQVVAPVADGQLLLPDNPLCWTSVAYLLWDEIDPEQLSAGQRTALVDWLHWGGQLVISGPDSLDLLRDSFLAPYLPADSQGAKKFSRDDLADVERYWRTSRKQPRLNVVGEWSGLELKLRPEAEPLPAGARLFAERRVGRGRVLVTAMQLAERDLVNWAGGFQNLFNSLILRRAPRTFAKNDTTFIDDDSWQGNQLYVKRTAKLGRIDTSGNSKVRFFTRDAHDLPAIALGYKYVADNSEFAGFETRTLKNPEVPGGVASWNDFNATANAARNVLREAAGVNVPGSSFVVTCLGVYLVVLVPFNWFFFRALGRVELAWVAAPIIALASTWVVVKQAQLDIGFVRAQTEVAVLETQPNHARSHLTRYLSFYTSLSTTYDLEFDDPTAVAAPFARGQESPLRRGQSPTLVTYERQEKARLRGLTISSNSTDMAHTEQMFDLGGALRYDPKRRTLTNETDYDFSGLVVVRKRAKVNHLEGCWIGNLFGRSSSPVSFARVDADNEQAAFAAERTSEYEDAEQLSFEPLFAIAPRPQALRTWRSSGRGLSRQVPSGRERHAASLAAARWHTAGRPPPIRLAP